MGIPVIVRDQGHLRLNREWSEILEFNGIISAAALWDLESEKVKNVVRERGTSRCFLRLPDGGVAEAYIKRYLPIPVREKIKNILGFKPYAFDAFSEWDSLCAFLNLGLDTMTPLAAGRLPDGRSCNLTLGITDYVRASELVTAIDRNNPRRQQLILRIAEIVARMHNAGMAHQDLYLVHFFIREAENDRIFLIDLQRMIRQRKLSRRWRVKDLAQLLFSSQTQLSEEEIWSFWTRYCELTGIHPDNAMLSLAVRNKTAAILRHDRNRQRKKR